MNLPIIDLKRHRVQPDVVRLISEDTARRYNLIPLDSVGDSLVVVMEEPGDISVVDELIAQAKTRIQPAVGYPAQIREAIDLSYRAISEIEKRLHAFAIQTEPLAQIPREVKDEQSSSESPVVRALDLIIAQAVRDRASDIHIEPQENNIRVRYRVDGVLHDAMSLPSEVLEPVISRIKILGGMNITERRRPQDGQFSTKYDDREVDVRVSTMGTAHGETAVLRILDKSLTLFTPQELGFLPESMGKYQQMLESPFGIILVSGPTGSGKTTTLYASIGQLDRLGRNIVTIEDPIEYLFDNIKQIQVNEKAGITFASGLRAIMRLDPDIILVGEIRDSDTANTAIQAALTGHLVLSSIHANDSVSVPFRLMNLGVEPYLISSVLVGTLAQRMVRHICHYCRTPYQPSPDQLYGYTEKIGQEEVVFYHGTGCNFCLETGYLGRTGVFELMLFSDDLRRTILSGATFGDVKTLAIQEGMVTLQEDGMLKVAEGITTPEEVSRNVFSVV